MAEPLKLIKPDANMDLIIACITDLNPLFVQSQEWLAEHHAQGKQFTTEAVRVLDLFVKAAETSAREQGEAVAATRGQTEVIATAVALTREVRRRGAYVATEVRRDPAPTSQGLARQVELGCGIGLRINTERQTGLRRLLGVQQQGLPGIQPILEKYKQPADLLDRIVAVKDALEESIRIQSKEALEAALAQDELERRCAEAVDWVNRILRLVNLEWQTAPLALRNGLLTIQGDHPGVFRGQRPTGTESEEVPAPDEEPALLEEP